MCRKWIKICESGAANKKADTKYRMTAAKALDFVPRCRVETAEERNAV